MRVALGLLVFGCTVSIVNARMRAQIFPAPKRQHSTAVLMSCISIHGVRLLTEPIFYRGPHGQESDEGKEELKGSHQEGGKEDFKEKEVVVSATAKIAASGSQPGHLSKGSEMSFAAVRYRGKVRPDLYAGSYCIKVRFFVSDPREGHDLPLRRIDAAITNSGYGLGAQGTSVS